MFSVNNVLPVPHTLHIASGTSILDVSENLVKVARQSEIVH